MSESATSKDIFAPFVKGMRYGIDAGFGGSSFSLISWNQDQESPYANVGGDRQILRGDARSFPYICDEALDFIHSSHLLEDFDYQELASILSEWRRCLRTDGLLLINCPDQQKYSTHCAATGQPVNLAHKEPDFSLDTFKKVLFSVGNWGIELEEPNHGPYSWLLVAKRIA